MLALAVFGGPGAAQSTRLAGVVSPLIVPAVPGPEASDYSGRGRLFGNATSPAPAPRVPWVRGPVHAPEAPPDRWFASDKLKHLFLSFGVTGFAHATARLAGAGDAAERIAAGTTAFAGLGKEISDHRRGWSFSLPDLVWDAAGIAAALVILRDTS